MTRNILYTLLLAFVVICLTSCQDDDLGINNLGDGQRNCDIILDDFSIAPDSRSSSVIGNVSELVFINERGEETVFAVGEPEFISEEGTFMDGDSITFCLNIESFTTNLVSNNGLEFTVIVESKPYYPEIKTMPSADVLKVFYNDAANIKNDRRLVFRKVLDIKDYPAPLYTTTSTTDEIFFIDTEFQNVEFTAFNSPIIKMYYNDNMGIVAYEDEQTVLWQLKN